MMPVKVCLAGDAASAATTSRLKIRCFIIYRFPDSAFCAMRLSAGGHEVGSGSPSIHDRHGTGLIVVRQSERLRGCARHGDGHVQVTVLAVRSKDVVPHRSV